MNPDQQLLLNPRLHGMFQMEASQTRQIDNLHDVFTLEAAGFLQDMRYRKITRQSIFPDTELCTCGPSPEVAALPSNILKSENLSSDVLTVSSLALALVT